VVEEVVVLEEAVVVVEEVVVLEEVVVVVEKVVHAIIILVCPFISLSNCHACRLCQSG